MDSTHTIAICVLKLIRIDSSSGPPGHGPTTSSSSSLAGMSSSTILVGDDGASGTSGYSCLAHLLADSVGLTHEGPASISETWH